MGTDRVVFACRNTGDEIARVRECLEGAGILARVSKGTRVSLKPNLTYPYPKRGVTTCMPIISAAVKILTDAGAQVAIVETDGGYGAWEAEEAFRGHGLDKLAAETGAKLVNLCQEPREDISFEAGGRTCKLPLPTRLLHETDVMITMPVPKIHAMTLLTLGYKNQWGCVPDRMRLRRHYHFSEAIVAINKALKPAVLADGTWFLDSNGPMDGEPVKMDLVIGASDAGAFDLYASELMGVSWKRVGHLRRAVALGDMPGALSEIRFNTPPSELSSRKFKLNRTMRNRIALVGFKSRFMTWLGYESWFGRVILHGILYAIMGPNVPPRPEREAA